MTAEYCIVTNDGGPEEARYPSYEAAAEALRADPDYTEGDMGVWIEEI